LPLRRLQRLRRLQSVPLRGGLPLRRLWGLWWLLRVLGRLPLLLKPLTFQLHIDEQRVLLAGIDHRPGQLLRGDAFTPARIYGLADDRRPYFLHIRKDAGAEREPTTWPQLFAMR
jgi:hypothetical protein